MLDPENNFINSFFNIANKICDMISTFEQWLNENKQYSNPLTVREYNAIAEWSESTPEYDEEDDPNMPRVVAEYLEEIKATDPLSKKYLEIWKKALEESGGDTDKAIDKMYDMDEKDENPEITEMWRSPYDIEATPGVSYDEVSEAIYSLGVYNANFSGEIYCSAIRGWVPENKFEQDDEEEEDDDDYDYGREVSDVISDYEELVDAIRKKNIEYLERLRVDLIIELSDILPDSITHRLRGKIRGKKFGL